MERRDDCTLLAVMWVIVPPDIVKEADGLPPLRGGVGILLGHLSTPGRQPNQGSARTFSEVSLVGDTFGLS